MEKVVILKTEPQLRGLLLMLSKAGASLNSGDNLESYADDAIEDNGLPIAVFYEPGTKRVMFAPKDWYKIRKSEYEKFTTRQLLDYVGVVDNGYIANLTTRFEIVTDDVTHFKNLIKSAQKFGYRWNSRDAGDTKTVKMFFKMRGGKMTLTFYEDMTICHGFYRDDLEHITIEDFEEKLVGYNK